MTSGNPEVAGPRPVDSAVRHRAASEGVPEYRKASSGPSFDQWSDFTTGRKTRALTTSPFQSNPPSGID